MRPLQRFRLRRPSRFGEWYLAGAILLTLAWLLARSLAPAGGLTRSYYYPLPRDANPRALDTRTLPVVEEPAAGVDLAFLEELHRPVRDYFVRWRGVWFSPRQERIDFRAGADDGVIVRIDGEVVLERHPAVGMHTEMRSVALEAGAHALQIDHWQRGAARRLNVQSSPAGGEPEPIRPGRLFPADPGALGYWLRVATVQLAWPVLLVWAAGPATWLGRKVWRGAAALTAREVGARLRVVTLPAFLGPAQVLLFGPWTVHATNRAEFLAPFWSLAPRWIGLLGLVTGLLVAIGLLLPPRGFRRYAAGLCAAGVLLWAQGNLLVADYGLLDGGGLDLTPPAGRVPFEAALWIGVLALALGFAGAVSRAAPTASALLVGLQAAVLLLPPLAPAAPRSESGGAAESWRLPPAAIYELSADRNLIHIVLDMFPSHIFAEIRDGDRPAFDRGWSGFTFFREHLGAFRTTLGSMPAMLTGVPWRNEMRFDRYARRHPSVFHALGRHGYRLRSLTAYSPDHPSDRFPGAEGAVRYTIPSPYGSYRDYVDSASAQLLDLSLFRHAPHGVKARIYRDDRWLFQQWIEARRGAVATAWRSFGDTVFLQEFASRITAAGDAPVYSFLHLITPHPPISTDAECVYPGRRPRLTRAGYLAQAQCALRVVRTLLDRLRDLGLYDRSAIIVTSDHGLARFPAANHPLRGIGSPAGRSLHIIESDATPLLLIKPFGAQGPLQTSDAPTAITDLPATLLDLAGLPNTLDTGTSALALDPARPRERTYAYHSWGGRNTHTSRWYDVLHLFSVDGRVTDPAAWRYRRAIFEPADDRAAQRGAHRIGLWADEDAAEPAAGRRTYVSGEYAAFFVPADTGRVTFDVRKAPALAAQTVTVRVDGRVVDRRSLTDDAWHTLDYAVEARDADNSPLCVELLVSPAWRTADDNPRGVLLRGDL